jgi:hypothetical protein
MNQLIRMYHHLEFDEIKAHLLEYGVLSGICSNCKEVNQKLDAQACSKCATPFKYIAFQNVKEHLPKILRILHERPDIRLIDYQDFKRIEGEQRARGILG